MLLLAMLLLGVGGLYIGAEWLVQGASRIAAHLRVSTLIIGLTVVAFGTSMPEVLAGVVASWRGASDIVLGNVLGSNIANVGLILGLCALIRTIPVHLRILYREVPLMLGATAIGWATAVDGLISRFDGLVLLALLCGATVLMLRWARTDGAEVREELLELEHELGLGVPRPIAPEVGRVLAGLLALSAGAHLLVESAIAGARILGVSEFVISVTVVAIGTSLPELATSTVAAVRGESDLLVGNLVGSNLFNVLGALAVAAIIAPVPVAPAIAQIDFPITLGFGIAMAFALGRHHNVTRTEGAVLLVAYVLYVTYAVA